MYKWAFFLSMEFRYEAWKELQEFLSSLKTLIDVHKSINHLDNRNDLIDKLERNFACQLVALQTVIGPSQV